MSAIPPLAEMGDALRRRGGILALTLTTGLALGVNVAMEQQPLFEAREILRIAPPKVSPDLVASTVTAPMATQVPRLRDTVLAPGALEDIARAYGLYPDLAPPARASRLAQALNLRTNDDGTLQISARQSDPEAARLVAQEVAHRMIHESAAQRIGEARATLQFLRAEELRRAEATGALDARIEAALEDPGEVLLPLQVLRTELDSLAFVLVRIDKDRAALGPAPEPLGEAGEAATLDRQRAALRARQAEVSRQLDLRAEQEARLAGLRAQRQTLGADLAEVAARRARAEAGYRLEMRRQSERMIVVAPAETPTVPAVDPRPITIGLMLMGGLIAGLFWIAALEARNPALRSATRMRRLTGITPLASIPVATAAVLPPHRALLRRITGRKAA